MAMKHYIKQTTLIFFALTLVLVQGFAPLPGMTRSSQRSSDWQGTHHQPRMIVAETNKGTPSSSVTALAAAGPADGSDRGAVLMGIVFLVSVWIFSIPPEFRRAHICTSDLCVENRSACYDCVTIGEWSQSVKEYYQNGGGISFDFSVAQETKDLWAGNKK